MREYKFRAWHKPTNTMQIVAEISFINNYVNTLGVTEPIYNIPLSECELMQFTALKDKNGKEIYEGDILRIQDPYNGNWSIEGGVVVFSYEYVGGWVITDNTDNLNIGTRTKHVEIIGNQFENPELLEQSHEQK